MAVAGRDSGGCLAQTLLKQSHPEPAALDHVWIGFKEADHTTSLGTYSITSAEVNHQWTEGSHSLSCASLDNFDQGSSCSFSQTPLWLQGKSKGQSAASPEL